MYTVPDSFRGQKALIAAQFSGAKVDVAKDFNFGVTNKDAKFLSKFPMGKVSVTKHSPRYPPDKGVI